MTSERPLWVKRGQLHVNPLRLFGAACGYAVLAFVSLSAPQPALGDAGVITRSNVFVERIDSDQTRKLMPANQLRPGDRVVYLLSWSRQGGNGSFVLTNPLPQTITYLGSASQDEEVSVDGGATWGRIGVLTLGDRLATASDVTHVRWHIAAPIAAKGSGRIAWNAIVR